MLGPRSPFCTGPLRTIDDIEYTAMQWIDRYNDRRLYSELNYTPPGEYETAYHAHP